MSDSFTRKYEPKCHCCAFCRAYPEAGEQLEAWLVMERDISWIAKFYNDHEWWKDKHKPFNYNKLYKHKKNHLPARAELMNEAAKRSLSGNITIEQSVLETLGTVNALKAVGMGKVSRGEIEVNSLSQLLNVMEIEHKMLGGDKIQIIQQGSQGLQMPTEILMSLVEVMSRFVKPADRMDFRKQLDEVVFPKLVESLTGQKLPDHEPEPVVESKQIEAPKDGEIDD